MPKKFTVPGGWVDTEDPNFKAVSEEAFKKTETFRGGEAAKVANEAQIKSDALAAKNDKDIPLKAPFPAPAAQIKADADAKQAAVKSPAFLKG